MKPITNKKEIFKIEMWLVELKVLLECEAETQPFDMQQVYLSKAKEIKDYLESRHTQK